MQRLFPWLLLLLAGFCLAAQSAPLQSPWDTLTYVPHAPLVGWTCPDVPALPVDMHVSGYYADDASSIIDPAKQQQYKQQTGSWYRTLSVLNSMADRFVQTGDAGVAACAIGWLDQFARQQALTGTMSLNQSSYVQGWILGALAIDWLKLRSSYLASADQQQRVSRWLVTVARHNMAYYQRRPKQKDAQNNHRYWAGMAVMATGVVADDHSLFDWGVESFHMGTAQITRDGTLPLEMAREGRALHYHLFAITPMVIMAELAMPNKVDLYADNNRALALLVKRTLAGVADPAFFAGQSGVAQEPVVISADNFAWLVPYQRRFPSPAAGALLKQLPARHMLYIGGEPPP